MEARPEKKKKKEKEYIYKNSCTVKQCIYIYNICTVVMIDLMEARPEKRREKEKSTPCVNKVEK
jgi:hypothetical protein